MNKKYFRLGLVLFLAGGGFGVCPHAGETPNRPEGAEMLPIKIDPQTAISIIYRQESSSRITILQVLAGAGKKMESPDQKGISYLTTRLALELPDRSMVKKLMHLGSGFFWQVEGDFAVMTLKSLSENFEATLEIFGKTLSDPLFSSLRIGNVKKQMEFQREAAEDDLPGVMSRAYLEAFFTKEGYGGNLLGDEETLERIKKRDVERYYRQFFNLSDMAIAISTDLEREVVKGAMEKWLARLPAAPPEKTAAVTAAARPDRAGRDPIFIKKEKEQTLVSYGARLPAFSRQNYVLAFMLDNLLGKGIGSRLWRLRSELKLAYSVNTRLIQLKDGGILCIYLMTDREKREKSLAALKKTLGELFEEGITGEELRVTKVYSKADFFRLNETKSNRALNLALFEAYGADYRFLEDIPSEIDSVTLEQVNRYIKEILEPAGLVQVSVGPE